MHMIVFTPGTPPPSPPSLSLSGVNLTSDGMCSLTSVTVDWEVSKVDDFRYWNEQIIYFISVLSDFRHRLATIPSPLNL